MYMWEIIIPCMFEDNKKHVSTKHHKKFDEFVLKHTTGLTILKPCVGKWLDSGSLYTDRVIPVRIACTAEQIAKIADFALAHYRQKAILYYKLSNEVHLVREKYELACTGL